MPSAGLQGRILRSFGLLTVGAVLGSLLLVRLHTTSRVRDRVAEELETSSNVFEEVLATRGRALITTAMAVREIPVLQRAARAWNSPLVTVAFRHVNDLVGSDVVLLTDRKGLLLAGSDARFEVGEIFDETTSVALALRNKQASSLWVQEGRLYQMVSVPLRLRTGIAGTLTVGYAVDESLAEEIAAISGADVAFLVDGAVVASSRPITDGEGSELRALVGRLGAAGGITTADVPLDPARSAMAVRTFDVSDAPRGAAYAVLRSLEKDVAELRALEGRLAAIAASALLAVLGIGYIVSRSLSRPLTAVATAARELGGGNYDVRLPSPGGTHEIVELTRAFAAMRDSLRERIEELRALAENLEELVAERTSALESALDENRRLLDELRRANDELEQRVEARSRELAEAQQLLVRQERMVAIGRLAAGVAHEINNPLGILSGFAEGLLDRARDPELGRTPGFEDFPENLRLIVEEVERLKQIVQRFLSFSRTKSPRKTAFDLELAGRRVLELLENHARQQGKSVRGAWSGEGLWIEADPEQIHQVVLNLVLNALDAVDRHGHVVIRTGERDGEAVVVVEDDGPGIAPELRDRVFDPFFSTKPPEQGTGLGLSLCHDLVRENGGTVEIDETATGTGAAFVVRFPLLDRKEQARA